MGNRSLDDFLAGGDAGDEATDDDTGDATVGDEAADGTAEAAADEATSDADATAGPDTDEVDPAVSTYVGRTGECAACGETVRRRWQSEDGPVCPACKAW